MRHAVTDSAANYRTVIIIFFVDAFPMEEFLS